MWDNSNVLFSIVLKEIGSFRQGCTVLVAKARFLNHLTYRGIFLHFFFYTSILRPLHTDGKKFYGLNCVPMQIVRLPQIQNNVINILNYRENKEK